MTEDNTNTNIQLEDGSPAIAKPMLGVVYLVSRYNDGEHPSSDVIKIFQNRIDAEQFVEEMKEKHKDNISFKHKHFYFEIDEMDVN